MIKKQEELPRQAWDTHTRKNAQIIKEFSVIVFVHTSGRLGQSFQEGCLSRQKSHHSRLDSQPPRVAPTTRCPCLQNRSMCCAVRCRARGRSSAACCSASCRSRCVTRNLLLLSLPDVCPEPVLVKTSCFIAMKEKGAKSLWFHLLANVGDVQFSGTCPALKIRPIPAKNATLF